MAKKLKVTIVPYGNASGVQVRIDCDGSEELDDCKKEVMDRLEQSGFTPRNPPPTTAHLDRPGQVTIYNEFVGDMTAILEQLKAWAVSRSYEVDFPQTSPKSQP